MDRPKRPVDYPEQGPHFALGQWKTYAGLLEQYVDSREKQIADKERSDFEHRVLSEDEL